MPSGRMLRATAFFLLQVVGLAASQTPKGLLPSEIFRRERSSIVVIIATSGSEDVQGSGFIVGQDKVATNYHVLANTSEASVIFSDGGVAKVRSVVADSKDQDLIIVSVPTGSRPKAELGDDVALSQGDEVVAIGAPRGLELTITNGIVSSFRASGGQFLIQSTAPIAPGSSGGPLMNMSGRVVGITTSLLNDSPGIYFSVGVSDLKRLMKTPNAVLMPYDQWASANLPLSDMSQALKEIGALIDKDDYKSAKAKIDRALKSSPSSPELHRLNGFVLLQLSDLSGALVELALAVKLGPDIADSRVTYAFALYQARRYRESLAEASIAMKLSDTWLTEDIFALASYAVGDNDKAEIAAKKALQHDAKDDTALEVLTATAYWNSSSATTNWKDYATRLEGVSPRSTWAQLYKAINMLSSDHSSAVEIIRATKEKVFPEAFPYIWLAQADRESSASSAEAEISEGLTVLPDNTRLLGQGVFSALRVGRKDLAGQRFASLKSRSTESAITASTGCLYFYAIEQPNESLGYCKKAVESTPNSHTAYSNYGYALVDAAKFQDAYLQTKTAIGLMDFKKASETQQVDILWLAILADYFSGHEDEAHAWIKAGLEADKRYLDPNFLAHLPLIWSDPTMAKIKRVLAA